jgi:hypothetical protein
MKNIQKNGVFDGLCKPGCILFESYPGSFQTLARSAKGPVSSKNLISSRFSQGNTLSSQTKRAFPTQDSEPGSSPFTKLSEALGTS